MNLRIAEAERARDAWKIAVVRTRVSQLVVIGIVAVAIISTIIEMGVLHRRGLITFAFFAFAFIAYGVHVLLANQADIRHREVLDAIRVLDYGNDDSYAASRRILQSVAEFERR